MGGKSGRVGPPIGEGASLVVIANRLPVDPVPRPDGTHEWRRSVGGLVTGLGPIVEAEGGAWLGWASSGKGAQGAWSHLPERSEGIQIHPVDLPARQAARYYDGYSNSTLWPLYHDVVEPPRFRHDWWRAYVAVNRKFAQAAAEIATEGATVWVQDYHFQLVPAMLRYLRPDLRIGFFLHIPVPEVEVFRRLPHRAEILRGLLGADLIGVQSPSAVNSLRRLFRSVLGIRSRGGRLQVDGRTVTIAGFPVSVDVRRIEALAGTEESAIAARKLRHELGLPRTIIVSVERLDYTKGVEQRLRAFRDMLGTGRLVPAETALIQVLPASRQSLREYRVLRQRVGTLVDRINTSYGAPGRPVIHHWEHSHALDELVPLYMAADVMAVTPLRDGMNLVAKEYVAARIDGRGALVLSEFAGAAEEMSQAYLVNPFDHEGLQDALCRAAGADAAERGRRIRAMRSHLRNNDAFDWGNRFLAQLRRGPVP